MNSAWQNLPHHLGALRQRVLDPTDYELAVNYFLEGFAGDVAFGSVTAGKYSATNVRVHQPRSPGFVKR
jgi:hypothetical protein